MWCARSGPGEGPGACRQGGACPRAPPPPLPRDPRRRRGRSSNTPSSALRGAGPARRGQTERFSIIRSSPLWRGCDSGLAEPRGRQGRRSPPSSRPSPPPPRSSATSSATSSTTAPWRANHASRPDASHWLPVARSASDYGRNTTPITKSEINATVSGSESRLSRVFIPSPFFVRVGEWRARSFSVRLSRNRHENRFRGGGGLTP